MNTGNCCNLYDQAEAGVGDGNNMLRHFIHKAQQKPSIRKLHIIVTYSGMKPPIRVTFFLIEHIHLYLFSALNISIVTSTESAIVIGWGSSNIAHCTSENFLDCVEQDM